MQRVKIKTNLKIWFRQYIKMAVQNILLPVVYRVGCIAPVEKGLVIFADAHHNGVPASMEPLVREVKRRRQGLKILELYDDYQGCPFPRLLKRMLLFMKYYARAEFVVICDNFLPASSCKKRAGTTVIQLWHGCGAFKKFGYDTQGDIPAFYKGNVFKNYDIVTVSAPECVRHFQSAMRQPHGVPQPLGVCRTDKYFRASYNRSCRELFLDKHPEAKGKKVILWAPTFRGNPADPELGQYADIIQMSAQLSQEAIVIIKIHPHLVKKYPSYDNSTLTTDQLLPSTDLLITDYSSILFEYSIYQKPMLFYAPDRQEYGVERGFYLDYGALPGPIVTDKTKLATEARRLLSQNNTDSKAVEAFYKTYMSSCDGQATKRIADIICPAYRKISKWR